MMSIISPDDFMTLEAPWPVISTGFDTVKITGQGIHPRHDTQRQREMGTFIRPPAATSTRPPLATFTWPRTPCHLERQFEQPGWSVRVHVLNGGLVPTQVRRTSPRHRIEEALRDGDRATDTAPTTPETEEK